MIKRLHQKTLQLLIKYHIICIDFDSEQETEKFLDKTNILSQTNKDIKIRAIAPIRTRQPDFLEGVPFVLPFCFLARLSI